MDDNIVKVEKPIEGKLTFTDKYIGEIVWQSIATLFKLIDEVASRTESFEEFKKLIHDTSNKLNEELENDK